MLIVHATGLTQVEHLFGLLTATIFYIMTLQSTLQTYGIIIFFCENCVDQNHFGTSGNVLIYQLNTLGVIHKMLMNTGEKLLLAQISKRLWVASSKLMKMLTSHLSFGDNLLLHMKILRANTVLCLYVYICPTWYKCCWR